MENFTTGLLVALQGILIVFAVLVILMIVLYIMKLFAKEETKVAAKSSVSAPVAAPTKRLRVMSIRRQGSSTPLWTASK
mgnify:CR=1 FL=1